MIATLIDGCTDVEVGDLNDGPKSGLASTATCTLAGRQVDVNSWVSPSDASGVEPVLAANKVEAYFAKGQGWTVTTHDDGTLQMQLTNDAAGLLQQAMDGTAPPSTGSDVLGQKEMAKAVVASLGGQIIHVVP